VLFKLISLASMAVRFALIIPSVVWIVAISPSTARARYSILITLAGNLTFLFFYNSFV